MLNEEKVRYMTELAVFEKNEGRKIFPINRYFKRDYVGGQMFRSFFGFTFCYILLTLIWVFLKLEEMMNGMSIDELLKIAQKWGMLYGAGLILYLALTWWIYSKRYEYASRSQRMYISKLKHLLKKYGKDKPDRTRDNRGGRVR